MRCFLSAPGQLWFINWLSTPTTWSPMVELAIKFEREFGFEISDDAAGKPF